MSVIEFHIWSEDNPVGEGNKLAVITDEDVVAGETGPAIWYEPALHGLGGTAGFSISRHSELATTAIIREDNLVRVKVPEISSGYLPFAWWMKSGQFHLIDSDEQGGENITIEGPGLLHKLATGSLYHSSTVGDQPARGSADREGLWWWIDEPYGAMLTRIMEEGRHSPYPDPAEAGSPLEFFDITFSRTVDSDSNAWPNIDNEFQVDIGIDLMTVADKLRESGNLYIVGDASDVDTLTVHCYQSYGEDLAGAFGSGTVRFERGVNVATELVRRSEAGVRINKLLLRNSDGDYSTETLPGFSAGDVEHWGFWDANQTNDDTLLNAIGLNVLRASQTAVEPVGFEAVPGKTPTEGRYLPGLHYNVGDTVTVHTGSDDEDYNEADQLVVAYRVSIREAASDSDSSRAQRSLKIEPQLNYYSPRYGSSNQGTGPTMIPTARALELCRLPYAGTDDVIRLYPSNSAHSVNPALHAGWDTGTPNADTWTATPDATFTGGGTGQTNNADGDVAGLNVAYFKGYYGPLSSAEAALIAAGGMVLKGYTRVRAKSGIGISESSQNMISNISVRVTAGATTTIRGTALAPHTLASSAGSTKWRANTQHQNRLFPAEAASDILSAVGACVSGDYLEITEGCRNFTVSGENSGGAWLWCNDEDTDLPEDLVSVADLNNWIEFVASGVGSIEGDLPLDTVLQGEAAVGTSRRAARCDHQHSHGLLSPDGIAYHGISQLANYVVHGSGAPTATDDEGDDYRNGTHWIDDDTGDLYFLVDQTEGAAVWIALGGSAGTAAEDVTITDTGGYFTGTEVEAALQELGASIAGLGGISGIFGSGLSATFVGANNGAGGLTITVNKPGGTADGDLVIFVVFGHNVTPNSGGPAAGGGAWTERLRFDTDGAEWIAIYTKIASSEGASWTITTGSSSTTLSGAWAIVLRGPTTFVRSRYQDESLVTGLIDGEPIGHQICIWISALAGGTLFDISSDPRITQHYANRMTAGEGAIMVASRPTTYIFPQPIFEATAAGINVEWMGNLTMIWE